MTKRQRQDDRGDALLPVLRAIAARDGAAVARLLEASPTIALSVVEVGATRQEPTGYFFQEIPHHAYAGDTALHLAAAAHMLDVAEKLVAMGANVRARNRRGAEPIHYAADGSPGSDGWSPDAQYAIVELLIRSGADPNAEDKSGVAPLHRAVRTRSTGAVRALLAGGAAVRAKNKSGSTPLHLAVQDTGRSGSGASAAREEQTAVIRLLLAAGARPSDKSSAGKSVIDCASADWIREILGVRDIPTHKRSRP